MWPRSTGRVRRPILGRTMSAPDPTRLRRTGADAVIFDDAGRILLQRRADFNLWGLPGGSVETGETLEQAVRREAKEETGYDVRVVRLVGAYSDPAQTTARYSGGDVVHYVSLVFECRIAGGRMRVDEADGESTALGWFSPDALPPDLMGDHAPRIADALARREAAFVR